MTNKIYKSAQGKEVDLGSLFLKNEHVRAVGNMNVNARGDKLDGNNQVIEQKNRQSQRQYQKQSKLFKNVLQAATFIKLSPEIKSYANLLRSDKIVSV